MKSFKRKAKIYLPLLMVGAVIGLLFTNCSKQGFDAAVAEIQKGDDPFLGYAWHINNTGQSVFATSGSGVVGFDLNMLKAWTSGLSGSGLKIVVSDDGIQDAHEDLKDNFLYGVSINYHLSTPTGANNAPPNSVDDNHGTAVAGLIAAVGGNGVGTKGIAYKSKLIAYNLLSSNVAQLDERIGQQVTGGYDIYNMSWGSSQNNLPVPVAVWGTSLVAGVTNGRAGKGSIYVKSAGNDFIVKCHNSTTTYCVGNANFDPDNNMPYTLMTGALNSMGEVASYSSPGANLWVSSFGGEFGDDYPAMITTDRSGCSAGYAQTLNSGKVEFERGSDGNSKCNYTTTFNGTSAAAPVLAGAIALILEANPNLTWRDVKYILAKTAVQVSPNMSNVTRHPFYNYPGDASKNVRLPTGAIWENAWVTNAAGFKFHNWFGFGRVNVDAAVALARNYSSPYTAGPSVIGFLMNSSPSPNAIPDYDAAGISSTLSVGTSLRIEAVQVQINISHNNIADLGIELISPSGTKSMIVNMRNSLTGIAGFDNDIFLSNAFFHERSNGTWTLKVYDGASNDITGTLNSWGVKIIGTP
ncbi:S8 family serine peptidase [Bdellovibrio bacteriovorus]|uniref:S8 family peptidase n=1 Tax=Bdellovibrio bacteriovorus TaxID=959 RepID=UPI0021D2B489|nr:S8 family peptidase [Bdellovibrio bacteriovorus]UXR65401.1 S8 family serine peptidase [Bdellovibrio bacteriovorus]